MYKVLVTGASGQLGCEIREVVGEDSKKYIFCNSKELDISDFSKVNEFVSYHDIDIVINCAAYTAVDRAEDDREKAYEINVKAVQNLAEVIREKEGFLIQISSDYVFDGKSCKPYCETDKTNPINYYGDTKLKSEQFIQSSGCDFVIIRTSWVYSSFGSNFVKTMLNLSKSKDSLGVIFDQVGTPTYARDLAKVLVGFSKDKQLKEKNLKEIYHYSNEGVCSWYDFAKAIFEIKDIDVKVSPIKTKDYPTPAKRPHFSALDKSKLKADMGVEIPYWRDSLERCLGRVEL